MLYQLLGWGLQLIKCRPNSCSYYNTVEIVVEIVVDVPDEMAHCVTFGWLFTVDYFRYTAILFLAYIPTNRGHDIPPNIAHKRTNKVDVFTLMFKHLKLMVQLTSLFNLTMRNIIQTVTVSQFFSKQACLCTIEAGTCWESGASEIIHSEPSVRVTSWVLSCGLPLLITYHLSIFSILTQK